MKITAIKQARFIALFDVDELIPSGLISMSRIAPAIVKRFEFQKNTVPEEGEGDGKSKGFEFFDGIWEGTPVQRLAVFNDGIIIETRVSTTRSREILDASLEWAKVEFGIHAASDIMRRLRYLSVLSFQSNAPILSFGSALSNMAAHMSTAMASITGSERIYSGTRIDINFDRSTDKEPIAGLTIQTLALEPFESRRYYSQAPLPTDEHVALLENFESDVLASSR
jgi:hypothetical protein